MALAEAVHKRRADTGTAEVDKIKDGRFVDQVTYDNRIPMFVHQHGVHGDILIEFLNDANLYISILLSIDHHEGDQQH